MNAAALNHYVHTFAVIDYSILEVHNSLINE